MGHPFRHSVQGSADWRLAAAVAVVVVQVLHLLWTLLPPVDGAAQHWVANLFIDASVAAAFALVLTVAMRYRG
jgi:hypothetical protein